MVVYNRAVLLFTSDSEAARTEARSEEDREPEEVARDRRRPAPETRDREPGRQHTGGVDIDPEAHGCDARERGRNPGLLGGTDADHCEGEDALAEPADGL